MMKQNFNCRTFLLQLVQDISSVLTVCFLQENNTSLTKPYTDIETGPDYIIREFTVDIDPIELLWHRDDEDRTVEVIECGQGWKLQLDDELPTTLEPGTSIFILRHQWHRVIKGEGKLVVKIIKNEKP